MLLTKKQRVQIVAGQIHIIESCSPETRTHAAQALASLLQAEAFERIALALERIATTEENLETFERIRATK